MSELVDLMQPADAPADAAAELADGIGGAA